MSVKGDMLKFAWKLALQREEDKPVVTKWLIGIFEKLLSDENADTLVRENF